MNPIYVMFWGCVGVAGGKFETIKEARQFFARYFEEVKAIKPEECRFRMMDDIPDDRCRWYYP